MRKFNIILIALMAIPILGLAQLSEKKDVSYDDVLARINTLMQKDRQIAKDTLQWEAEHFMSKNTLNALGHARTIYSLLEMKEQEQNVFEKIRMLFPNSSIGISSSFNTMLSTTVGIEAKELSFLVLRQRFAEELSKDTLLYNTTLSGWIRDVINERDFVLAQKYIEQVTNERFKESLEIDLALKWFASEQWEELAPFLLKLYKDESYVGNTRKIIVQRYVITLVNLQRNQEAFQVLSNYAKKNTIDNEDLLTIYIEGLYANNQAEVGFNLIDSFLKAKTPSSQFLDFSKTMFGILKGNTHNWETYYNALIADKVQWENLSYVAAMVKEQAMDFELLDREGKLVKLADYRGKIVVLDFWATWCGPCIGSFPGMQAAVNHYSTDPDVVFLFINTRESSTKFKEKVDALMKKNAYSFHVLFDHNGGIEQPIVDAYDVKGIPAKFFIDKHGMIRFRSSGSSSNVQEVFQEVVAKINLIKKNS